MTAGTESLRGGRGGFSAESKDERRALTTRGVDFDFTGERFYYGLNDIEADSAAGDFSNRFFRRKAGLEKQRKGLFRRKGLRRVYDSESDGLSADGDEIDARAVVPNRHDGFRVFLGEFDPNLARRRFSGFRPDGGRFDSVIDRVSKRLHERVLDSRNFVFMAAADFAREVKTYVFTEASRGIAHDLPKGGKEGFGIRTSFGHHEERIGRSTSRCERRIFGETRGFRETGGSRILEGVIETPRRFHIVFLGISVVAIVVVRAVFDGAMRDGIGCLLAAIALFKFGAPLQRHSIGSLKKFRITVRTVLWFAACVAFWYSALIWVWWSRKTPSFPLFLLNSDLETTVFFVWVPLLILVGLALDSRSKLTV